MRWWERVAAWEESRRFPVDAFTALVLGLVGVPVSGVLEGMDLLRDSARSGDVAGNGALICLLMAVPLAWRRTRPTASAVAVFTVALGHLLLGLLLVVPADLLVLVALYSVTVHGPVWAYRTAIGGALLGSLLLAAALAADLGGLGALPSAVVVGGLVGLFSLTVFATGLVRRSRRESIDALVDRARRLEVERDQQAQIATAAERARIAREMHDIVAHSLSVMIAQADGGRYAAGQDPAAATRSLLTISETGRAALADMRRLLGVLRTDAPGRATPPPPPPPPQGSTVAPGRRGGPGPPSTTGVLELAPQPQVEDLDALVEQVRSTGVAISVVRLGVARTLPPGTGLSVYRICQEALTNVLKHAGPGPAVTVLLQWAATSLVLEVTDDGRGAAAGSDGAGQGVLGMRERAAMLGGTLVAGPRPGGGYRVRADIPIPALQEDR